MRVDYHTHHARCGHADGSLVEYVEAAVARGLDEIGLSDHSPLYHLGDDPHAHPWQAMSQHDLPAYIHEMAELRAAYAQKIAVRLGVESDYIEGWGDHYRALWRSHALDYVIGSVHWLGDWNIFSDQLPPGRSAEEIYQRYLAATQEAARSGAYDIIGHLDCLKTRGHAPDRWATPQLEETIRVLSSADVAIELNTSGWRKSVNECFPRPELLERCCAAGIPVTLGSDAHHPDQVGLGFDRALALLHDVGYRHIALFQNRKRRLVPITL
jgi:histidinol-phosphatase (PHP family)